MPKKTPMPLSATYFRSYQEKKYTGQSADDNDRMNQYIDWYRAAYDSKDERGIFDLYKTIDEYWEGNANEQVYEDDPASNTNIIHPYIEGQVALIVDENIEVQPHAQTPSEIEYIPSVKRMLDFVIENNNFIQTLDVASRRLLKYGTTIFNTQWDENWQNGFGLPKIRSCNPIYVYPDPNIVDIYSIQEGRFIIETLTKSIAWAERMFPDKADMIIPGYDPHYESTFYDENEYNSNEISNMHYLHFLIWEKYLDGDKLKLKLVQMSGDGTILYDSVEEGHEFCSNLFPYFFAPCYYREGTVWGKGDAELLLDQQEQINDIDDQVLNNARLTGNPQKVFDPSLVPDGEMWTNEAGLLLPANGGPTAVSYIMPPSMPLYPIQKRDRIIDIDIPLIVRFHPQMMGGRVKGVDTATEALAMQQSGMSGVDHKKRILGQTLSEMAEYILDMCMYYWDKEKYFTVTGDEDYVLFNPSKLKEIPVKKTATPEFIKAFKGKNPKAEMPEYMYENKSNGKPKTKVAQIKIHISIGAGLPKNKAFLYTAAKELFALGLIDPQTAMEYFRDVVGLPIPMQTQATPEVKEPKPLGDMQSGSMNIAGVPTSMNAQNAQGRRADKKNPMSQTPNVGVQGLNAKDVINTAGGGM